VAFQLQPVAVELGTYGRGLNGSAGLLEKKKEHCIFIVDLVAEQLVGSSELSRFQKEDEIDHLSAVD
jgi:hypothetical protein